MHIAASSVTNVCVSVALLQWIPSLFRLIRTFLPYIYKQKKRQTHTEINHIQKKKGLSNRICSLCETFDHFFVFPGLTSDLRNKRNIFNLDSVL